MSSLSCSNPLCEKLGCVVECSGCSKAATPYCSYVCQQNHWMFHLFECHGDLVPPMPKLNRIVRTKSPVEVKTEGGDGEKVYEEITITDEEDTNPPDYANGMVRLQSFNNHKWKVHFLSPVVLAIDAGFYFTGVDDNCRCPSCDLIIEDWEAGDNPMEIHKNRAPECSFVLSKGSSSKKSRVVRRGSFSKEPRVKRSPRSPLVNPRGKKTPSRRTIQSPPVKKIMLTPPSPVTTKRKANTASHRVPDQVAKKTNNNDAKKQGGPSLSSSPNNEPVRVQYADYHMRKGDSSLGTPGQVARMTDIDVEKNQGGSRLDSPSTIYYYK